MGDDSHFARVLNKMIPKTLKYNLDFCIHKNLQRQNAQITLKIGPKKAQKHPFFGIFFETIIKYKRVEPHNFESKFLHASFH